MVVLDEIKAISVPAKLELGLGLSLENSEFFPFLQTILWILGCKYSGSGPLSQKSYLSGNPAMQPLFWHERAAFQQSACGRLTAGNDKIDCVTLKNGK